ncbi:MAG: hypothetical protein IJ285_06085 [Clostridia bacterium]|nr:hypothetical protein [Clostridia bacterium]
MKKEEYIKLGITDNEVIRALQNLHGKDLERERKKAINSGGANIGLLRKTIKDTIILLKKENSLERVLSVATNCFYYESKARQQEDATLKEKEVESGIENKDNV